MDNSRGKKKDQDNLKKKLEAELESEYKESSQSGKQVIILNVCRLSSSNRLATESFLFWLFDLSPLVNAMSF